jgi:hypothetical protein
MELASYLAGERWSDHPACTHPLLAALARDVNDYTSDAARGRLAGLIPSVIGVTGDDLHIDARVALLCARTALPVAAVGRQQVMAVSVLVCERVLAGLDGRPAGWLSEPSRAALEQVPQAARSARDFTRDLPVTAKAFRRRSAPFTVHAAAEGIARACIPQPDEMLRELLVSAIGECAPWTARGVPVVRGCAAKSAVSSVERHRPGRPPVPRQDRGAGLLGRHELEFGGRASAKQTLAGAQDCGEGQQPVLVDQVVGHECAHDAQAAGDDHVPPLALDRVDDVTVHGL